MLSIVPAAPAGLPETPVKDDGKGVQHEQGTAFLADGLAGALAVMGVKHTLPRIRKELSLLEKSGALTLAIIIEAMQHVIGPGGSTLASVQAADDQGGAAGMVLLLMNRVGVHHTVPLLADELSCMLDVPASSGRNMAAALCNFVRTMTPVVK